MFLSKATTANEWIHWPERVSLTLKQTILGGTTSDAVAADVVQPTCRKRELTQDELVLNEVFFTRRSIVFEVWDRGQTRFPRKGDTLVEGNGTRWEVEYVQVKIFGNLYSCICTQQMT